MKIRHLLLSGLLLSVPCFGQTLSNPPGGTSGGGTASAQKGTLQETVVNANDAYYSSGVNVIGIAKNQLMTYNGNQYLCYFNLTFQPNIIKRNNTTGAVTEYVTGLPAGTQGNGVGDEHDSCAISFDTNGYIHLAYGMHSTALTYYRSLNPGDPSSWSSALPMLGTNETSVTYPFWIKNPVTGALYFTFRGGTEASGNQYFYAYNPGTTTWSAATGTGTAGLLINAVPDSYSPYQNGIPKWNTAGTQLWWNWEDWNGTVTSNVYTIYWDGSAFHKFGGASQTIPATLANLAASVTQTNLADQNDFNIDANGNLVVAYLGQSAGGIYQWYVADTSTGSWVVHQITNNLVPQPLSTFQAGECVFYYNGFMYLVLTESYDQIEKGIPTYQAPLGKYTTWTKFYQGFRFNPNWALNYDPEAYAASPSVISFAFMDADDYQYGITYLNKTVSNPNLGNISIVQWTPTIDTGTSSGIPRDIYGENTIGTNYLCLKGATSGQVCLQSSPAPAASGTSIQEVLPSVSGQLAIASTVAPTIANPAFANGNTVSNTVVTVSGITPGMGLLVYASHFGSNTVPVPTDSTGLNTYTLVSGPDTGGAAYSFLWVLPSVQGSPTTVTIPVGTSTGAVVEVMPFAGAGPNPIDQFSVNPILSSTSWVSSPINTSAVNEQLIAVGGTTSTAPAFSAGTGWTTLNNFNNASDGGAFSETLSATVMGTYTAPASSSPASAGVMYLVSIRPSSSSSTLFPLGFTTQAMTAQTTATLTPITGMTWPILANTDYKLSCEIPVTFAASATIQFGLVGPGTPTSYAIDAFGLIGAAAVYGDFNLTGQTTWVSTKTGASGAPGAVTEWVHVHANIQNGTTAGTLTLDTAANGANAITVLANSACELK